MGLPLWVIYLNLAFAVILVILTFLLTICPCCNCLHTIRLKLKRKLIWNGLIRLFLEIYADMAMTAFLNLYTADWSTESSVVLFSNVLSVVFLTLAVTVPIILICFFSKNW